MIVGLIFHAMITKTVSALTCHFPDGARQLRTDSNSVLLIKQTTRIVPKTDNVQQTI